MKIDRYVCADVDGTTEMTEAETGDWVPYVQVSRLLGTFTIRDRFAAAALANPAICTDADEYPQRTAYAFADAMLNERVQRK